MAHSKAEQAQIDDGDRPHRPGEERNVDDLVGSIVFLKAGVAHALRRRMQARTYTPHSNARSCTALIARRHFPDSRPSMPIQYAFVLQLTLMRNGASRAYPT
jgi:hypothetical protein